MKTIIPIIASAALAALAAPVVAQPQDTNDTQAYGREGRIAFANHNGIRGWRVEDNDTLLIEARGGDWYRAELIGPCLGLRFSNTLGFENNPDGSFDRFGKVVTDSDRCQLRSLVTIPDPDAAEAEAEPEAEAS